MASLNNGYTRWTGESTGIWRRRWVITQMGLELCLRQKLLRFVILLVYAVTLLCLGWILVFGQMTSPDSQLIAMVGETFGKDAMRVSNGVASWILLYPEVVVDGVFRLMYYLLGYVSSFASLSAVVLFVSKLITQDIATQAIVIYNSKALTRWDYLIGKFGIVVVILSLLWIVPVVLIWALGNLLSPDWLFFVHSFKALLRALFVAICAVLTLSALALAISSLARKSSFAVTLWMMLWFFSGLLGGVAQLAYPLGRYISVSDSLQSLAWSVYRLDVLWSQAYAMLPFFSFYFDTATGEFRAKWMLGPTSVWQPLFFLGVFVGISAIILNRRIRVA